MRSNLSGGGGCQLLITLMIEDIDDGFSSTQYLPGSFLASLRMNALHKLQLPQSFGTSHPYRSSLLIVSQQADQSFGSPMPRSSMVEPGSGRISLQLLRFRIKSKGGEGQRQVAAYPFNQALIP